MTYHPGSYGMRAIGIPDGEPRIVCDQCGTVYHVKGRGASGPPAWFLAGKSPFGWSAGGTGGGRWHRCGRCRKKGEQ